MDMKTDSCKGLDAGESPGVLPILLGRRGSLEGAAIVLLSCWPKFGLIRPKDIGRRHLDRPERGYQAPRQRHGRAQDGRDTEGQPVGRGDTEQ